MNVAELIRQLYVQKEKLGRAIAVLEDLAADRQGVKLYTERVERRGRKSMGAEERREVSLRMKKYWASRRKQSARRHQESSKETE